MCIQHKNGMAWRGSLKWPKQNGQLRKDASENRVSQNVQMKSKTIALKKVTD